MKIAIIGYGKMGKEVEKIAISRGHEITFKLSKSEFEKIEKNLLLQADIAVEFTGPESAVSNLKKCFDNGLPVVTGTTGWYNSFEDICNYCKMKNTSLFYASNFSLGVNLFFRLNEFLAAMMKDFSNYKISMEEQHHIHKKDAPSGTAIKLAEGIFKKNSKLKTYSLSQAQSEEVLPINVVRENEIPGTHSIKYKSDCDEIRIEHKAFNREGFALGAVLAAEFLVGKKGVFSMDDLISDGHLI
ncbi:MAG: 4-hydroxy-tetrahydrodipicolinate reductase [Bacteroidota bacterium]|jgi:4-hydroxy-tetrahydrodipicolinate reductase